MKLLGPLILLPTLSYAFQWPFQLPFFKTKVVQEPIEAVDTTPRIAIIGAGAAGSSAAFWIAKAKERFGLNVEIDVYDKAGYIGGRSTVVYPYNNHSMRPMELGASIFVQANRILWRAAEEFNLTLIKFHDEESQLGIWDGEHLRVTVNSKSWWDTLKMVWRYGITSPKTTEQIVQKMIQDLQRLYTSDTPRWDNIATLASSLGWSHIISNTTSEYFESHGVSKKYLYEIVEAATRVNYGQNADAIHALEGAVSLAATNAASISGGNFQLFEKFIELSNASLYLNTTVKSLTPKKVSSNHWTIQTTSGSSLDYRAVIIAAPFHSTGLHVPSWISSTIPKQPYVHLHVTLLSTNSSNINPEYLNLPSSTSKTPDMLLTTYEGVRSGGKEPEFNSLSYHGRISEDEWGVKIFSKQRLSDDWLRKVFGHIGWIQRHEWDAYPELPPTKSFPPVKLHNGLYYVNAFEPFISTMETQTLASRNVVDLALNDEFGSSVCGKSISSTPVPDNTTKVESHDDEKFVYGWDC